MRSDFTSGMFVFWGAVAMVAAVFGNPTNKYEFFYCAIWAGLTAIAFKK
jgi:hypothetical protein